MTPRLFTRERLGAELARFDAVIDTRTPAEFALDHIPGAINVPVLSDAERIEIGTLYRQESPFVARKRGAVLVARNIAHHLEVNFSDKPKTWRPLVYCWRGGQRSAAMTHVLGEIGWNALQLEGGYKGFRQTVVADLARFCDVFQFRVLCGPTGSGKSALLRAMSDFAQVLDLESLARHRGSLLGAIDDVEQPAQKAFETALWQTLRGFDAKRPVFVESEGARIGRLSLPLAFTRALRSSPCVVIETPDVLRIAHLLVQYPAWQKAPDKLSARLMALVGLHSRAKVARWQAMIAERSWTELVAALLHDHYDPAYRRSLESEFVQLKSAKRVRLDSFDAVSLLHAAHEISALGETGALAPSAAPKAHAETSAAR